MMVWTRLFLNGIKKCQNEVVHKDNNSFINKRRRVMKDINVIGIDIAKNVMQLHGADSTGKVLFKKRVTRGKFLSSLANMPKCLIGMEACAGAHHWARKLQELGFEVRLMSAATVKKYAEHQKNDANDAKACAIAVTRKDIRFVPIRTPAQLEMQAVHRIRSHYVKEKTSLMNMTRGLLLEHGIAIAQGETKLIQKLRDIMAGEEVELSEKMKKTVTGLLEELNHINAKIKEESDKIEKVAKEDSYCQRIQTIEGIGPISASAIIAKIGNGSEFKKGRELSAFLGLVPRQSSSGNKQLLLGISKHGDRYIRQLLIHGARTVVRWAKRVNKETGAYYKQDKHSEWIRKLCERIGINKTCVAVANKNARMIIAILKTGVDFEAKLAHGY
jgi:transposase